MHIYHDDSGNHARLYIKMSELNRRHDRNVFCSAKAAPKFRQRGLQPHLGWLSGQTRQQASRQWL